MADPEGLDGEPVNLDDEPQEPSGDLGHLDSDDDDTAAAQLAEEPPSTQGDADDEGEPTSQREAKYRLRLRDAEGERDAAVAKIETQHLELDALRSVEVLRLAEAVLIDGRDLMPDGGDLSSLLSPDGTVDPAKVAALAAQVIADRPHYGRPGVKRTAGFHSGATGPDSKPPTNWKSAFEPQPK